MTRPVAVVLAGGLGTRMSSRLPKVLHPVCGRPMLAYVLDAARGATGSDPVVVYSPATAAVRDAFPTGVVFALQERPDGTGDALRAGLTALPADADEVVVLSGDVPLVEADLIAGAPGAPPGCRRGGGPRFLRDLGAGRPRPRDPHRRRRAGRPDRGGEGRRPDELAVGEVNAGFYAFDAAWLLEAIARLTPSPVTGELYLTQLVDLAVADGRPVVAVRGGRRRDARRDQRPGPAGRGDGGDARADQRGLAARPA